MIKIVACALFLVLTGCGLAAHEQAREALSSRITADADACRRGDQNACRMYQLEIQRCSILSTDPVCENM